MIKLPRITFNGIFNGFCFGDDKPNFNNTYTLPNTRRNYHIIWFNGSWAVHGEGAKKIQTFANKNSAIAYAKERAQAEKTEALLHHEDATIETSWIYAVDAYPQKQLHPPDEYPVEDHPGEGVL